MLMSKRKEPPAKRRGDKLLHVREQSDLVRTGDTQIHSLDFPAPVSASV
jgi:hypothetical protein